MESPGRRSTREPTNLPSVRDVTSRNPTAVRNPGRNSPLPVADVADATTDTTVVDATTAVTVADATIVVVLPATAVVDVVDPPRRRPPRRRDFKSNQ